MRVPVAACALIAGLTLSACDGRESGGPTAPALSDAAGATSAPATASPPQPAGGVGSRLDCGGAQMSVGTADRVLPPPDAVFERSAESPTQLARGWLAGIVRNPAWASAGPFTVEQVSTRTAQGQRKIRVDFRAADGRILGTLGILWIERMGWQIGGWRACSASGSEGLGPAASSVVFYRAMFSPRVVRSLLRCSRGGSMGGIFDRRGGPPVDPRTLEQVVAEWASRQSNQANPDWDVAAPPAPRYYFPRDRAHSYRAVVDFVDAQTGVIASLHLDRWPNSDAWHLGFSHTCAYGPPGQKS